MKYPPGTKVKLVPWEQADHEPPGLDYGMEPFFGEIVTIKRQGDYRGFFIIEEDNKYVYDDRWIESAHVLPDKLFEI